MKRYSRVPLGILAMGDYRPKFKRLIAHNDCTEVAEAFYMLRVWRFDRREQMAGYR